MASPAPGSLRHLGPAQSSAIRERRSHFRSPLAAVVGTSAQRSHLQSESEAHGGKAMASLALGSLRHLDPAQSSALRERCLHPRSPLAAVAGISAQRSSVHSESKAHGGKSVVSLASARCGTSTQRSPYH